ncbi:hypothetical protein V1478_002358 [Vespula squamosa]|uniref:Uncharacterized protein n=1 Tax=Vespula squamosa TaxID=30214 RepID=A0ABD2BW63_VESSQ
MAFRTFLVLIGNSINQHAGFKGKTARGLITSNYPHTCKYIWNYIHWETYSLQISKLYSL